MTPILRSLIVSRQYQRQQELIPYLQTLFQDAHQQIHSQQSIVSVRSLQTSSSPPPPPPPSSPTSSSSSSSSPTSTPALDEQRPPDLPTTCCMSGCANCVWLDYADEIVKFYEERGSKANLDRLLEEIDRNVSDEMVKAFVKMEIKGKFLFSKSS